MRTEGSISTRSEMKPSAPTRQVKSNVTLKQPHRCSHLHNHQKKRLNQSHSVRLISGDASNPACRQGKTWRSFRAKTKHSAVASEAPPRLVQKLGRWFSMGV